MFTRRAFLSLVAAVVSLVALPNPASADLLKVGPYLLNAEGAFTASAQTYAVPLNLNAPTRLVVQAAPQYAMDFGIIPAADLKKWRNGQATRFYMRLYGATDTRYITLQSGAYYVVARDLNGGVVTNGFAIKVRRFTGKATDGGKTLGYLSSQKRSGPILPGGWDGFVFDVVAGKRMWFDGIFSRGLDRAVRWEILTGPEYQKFVSGRAHEALLSGTEPKRLGFEFPAVPARYYFVVINQGSTYTAFTVTRELYR